MKYYSFNDFDDFCNSLYIAEEGLSKTKQKNIENGKDRKLRIEAAKNFKSYLSMLCNKVKGTSGRNKFFYKIKEIHVDKNIENIHAKAILMTDNHCLTKNELRDLLKIEAKIYNKTVKELEERYEWAKYIYCKESSQVYSSNSQGVVWDFNFAIFDVKD